MRRSLSIIMGFQMGGIFSVYKTIVPALQRVFDVNILTMDNHLRQDSISGAREIDLDVVSPLRGLRLFRFLFHFLLRAKEHKLKYFVINNQGIAGLIYLASLFFRYHYVIHQHSTLNESISTKSNIVSKNLYLFLLRRAFKKARCVICNSKYVERDVKGFLGIDNTRVIYNPVDVNRVITESENTIDVAWEEGAFHFVSVGRLTPAKGFDVLIRAAKAVKEKAETVFKVHIIGGGEEEASLKKLIDDLDLSDVVDLTGFRKEPYEYIRKCNCYLSPSLWEGLGLTIIYAMILKKPIIASRTGGAMELLDPENTFFDIGDDADLSRLMIEMISKGFPQETILETNYHRALRFDSAEISGQFEGVFEELLAACPSGDS